MFQREITDKEFLDSFHNFTFAARPAISHLLCERLRDPSIKAGDEKAILLATLENYFFQTEIVLMLLESFHQKKENPQRSLVSIYNEVFIREGQNGEYSEILLGKITTWDNDQLIDYLGLKSPKDLIENSLPQVREGIEEMFGSVDKGIVQGDVEIKNLKGSLETVIANRIGMKGGTKLPFYKLLNKLKHGYQVVEDPEEKVLSIIIDVVEGKSDRAEFNVIEIPIKKDTAYFYSDQIKYMAQATRHLVQYYTLSYQN